jgi:hypothetical protein
LSLLVGIQETPVARQSHVRKVRQIIKMV